MNANAGDTAREWVDPDDAPEWTEEMFDAAEIAVGGKVVREASGHLASDGVRRGRPPRRALAKQQVTLRLDPDVIATFRKGGAGWQTRINEALRKAAGI
ncbi:MAG: BrnA antitoxin family protein [Sphingomonadaceae bacterium]|nr:BrnA antitoxin family protein [Sphingomonadaceae bacterium]